MHTAGSKTRGTYGQGILVGLCQSQYPFRTDAEILQIVQFTRNEFRLDLSSLQLRENNRAEIMLANSLLKRDSPGRFYEYKYFLHLSQTDCRLSIQVFSKRGKSQRVLLQQSISAFDVGSAELEGEYQYVENNRSNNVPDEDLEANVSHAGTNDSEELPLPPKTNESRRKGHKHLSIFDVPLTTTTESEGLNSPPGLENVASAVMQEVNNSQEAISAEDSDTSRTKRAKKFHPPSGHYAKYSGAAPRAPRTTTATVADHISLGDDSEHSEYGEVWRPNRILTMIKDDVNAM